MMNISCYLNETKIKKKLPFKEEKKLKKKKWKKNEAAQLGKAQVESSA